MDIYIELHYICRKLSVKANHSDEKEQKELRSEVGIQVDQAKAGKHELKSQIKR